MNAAPISQLPHKGVYARFLRTLRSLPADAIVVDPLSGWMRHSRPVREIRAAARLALDRRINLRGGRAANNEPICLDLRRDAWDLSDRLERRVRIYQFRTAFMRARFGHLLSRHDD